MKTTDETNALFTSGHHTSCWMDDNPQATLNPLRNNLETDVVIIGGGISGLMVAYCLLKAGKKIVVLEDGFIGSGETGRTTAHLTAALDDRYSHYEEANGERAAHLLAESHMEAIRLIEQIIRDEQISCDFQRVDGYLFRHPSDEPDVLEKELPATQRAGLDTRMINTVPGIRGVTKAIRFRNQAQFHPMKFLTGLADAVTRLGGQIFTSTHAKEITHEKAVSDDGYEVKAAHVVVAANTPVNNRFVMSSKQYAYRSYVIGALVQKNTLPMALWWDTGDYGRNKEMPPYHYVRLQPWNAFHDLLIVGGEDHPTGNPEKTGEHSETECYERLEAWTKEHFTIEKVVCRWSGQVMESLDGIPYIGRNPLDHNNVYIITGDCGDGMTNAGIAGRLITDLILGKANAWEDLYRPSRFALREGWQFLKHNIQNVFASFRQHSQHNSDGNLFFVQKGEGKIMDLEGETCGVYRNDKGLLTIVSAKCTHLGCTVSWNNDEKSWDCPCHGSRFTPEGKVINGPANTDLPAHQEQS